MRPFSGRKLPSQSIINQSVFMELVNGVITSLSNKEIETGARALAFSVTGAHGGATTPSGILTALLGTSEITVTKQSDSNTETLIQSAPLKDIAEICTKNNGVIYITTNGANATATFTVDLALGAALVLNDRSKLIVNISGLPASMTVIVDTVDSQYSSPSFVKFEPKFVNSNVGKDFDINASFAMALPIASLSALELTYANGKNVKLSAREIKQELIDSEEVIYVLDGKSTLGFDKWAVLGVEECVNARVTLSASTNFFLVKNQLA